MLEGNTPSARSAGAMRVVRLQHGILFSLRTSLAGFSKSSLGEYKVLGARQADLEETIFSELVGHVCANFSHSQTLLFLQKAWERDNKKVVVRKPDQPYQWLRPCLVLTRGFTPHYIIMVKGLFKMVYIAVMLCVFSVPLKSLRLHDIVFDEISTQL